MNYNKELIATTKLLGQAKFKLDMATVVTLSENTEQTMPIVINNLGDIMAVCTLSLKALGLSIDDTKELLEQRLLLIKQHQDAANLT